MTPPGVVRPIVARSLAGFDMLNLEHTTARQVSKPCYTLIDLPCELLCLILQYLYYSSGGYLSSIIPTSSTCRSLRGSAYSILFEKLTIKANVDIIQKDSWYFLHYLVSQPHLLEHVRCLEVEAALPPGELPCHIDIQSALQGRGLSKKRLFECLALMTGLRHVKLHYISTLILDLLELLRNTSSLKVSLDLSRTESPLERSQYQRLRQMLVSSPGWVYSVSMPSSRDSRPELVTANTIGAINWTDNGRALNILVARGRRLPYLEELHISSKILDAHNSLLTRGVIPWQKLKRLHVEGDRLIKILLSTTIDKLYSLEDLLLHATTTEAFHDGCLNKSRRPKLAPLPYTRLPSLQHLSLRGICPHLHARYLTTPTLTSLALIMPEYHARLCNISEARKPNEIRWIAANVPHLTHLELHIEPIENLWHPTAVPGVDVNPQVYSVLTAIAETRHLQTLRLYPPYVPRDADHDYLNPKQPLVVDEQALRVFRHLRNLRPSLHTLSIAATFYGLRDFSPSSWLVRDRGNGKTVVTTRQVGTAYEMRYYFDGERHTRTDNKKDSYRKPYLTDLRGGWVFPVEDPPIQIALQN